MIFLGVLLLILLLFRAVGAIHVRQTLARLRQRYARARQTRGEQQTFERLQLYLRSVQKSEGPKTAEPAGAGAGPCACPVEGNHRGLPQPCDVPTFSRSLSWRTVCEAAEQLELAWVSLEVTNAEGGVETSLWRRQDTPAGFARILTMSFPIHNVAGYRSVAVAIAVLVNGSLQSANHRAGLFARLAEECVARPAPIAREGVPDRRPG